MSQCKKHNWISQFNECPSCAILEARDLLQQLLSDKQKEKSGLQSRVAELETQITAMDTLIAESERLGLYDE